MVGDSSIGPISTGLVVSGSPIHRGSPALFSLSIVVRHISRASFEIVSGSITK